MNRAVRAAWPALTIAVALVASIVATAAVSGGSSALLVARAAALMLLVLSIGAVLGVVVAVVLLLPTEDARRGRWLDVAAMAAGLWAVMAASAAFLLYLGAAPPLSSSAFGPGLVSFVADVDLGRTWLIAAVAAAVLSALLVAVRSAVGVTVLGAVTVAVAVPVALQSAVPGESIAAGRTVAAAGLVQLVALSTWIGAVVAAGVMRATLPRVLPACCFAAVVLGVGAAWPTLATDGAVTPVAVAGAVAVVAAGVLAAIACASRRLPAFLALQTVLLAVGSGTGIAASVTRLLPDLPSRTTPAEILTGAPLPRVGSLASLLGTWQADPLWLVVCGALLAGYGAAALRATAWPLRRSLTWIAGVLLLAWLTNGAPAVYQEVLLEAHLLQHLALLLLVPVLLAGGAPGRLLLTRAHTAALRAGVTATLDSRALGLVARPVAAALIAAVVVLALYGSEALRWSVAGTVGTEVAIVVCLLAGVLLVHALTSAAAGRRAVVIVAVALLVLESGGAVAVALGSSLLLADWYGAMGWGTDAIAAQRAAAGAAWALAAVPTVLLLLRALRTARPRLARPEAAAA